MLILFVGCVAVGWTPDLEGIFAGVLGFAIITVLGTALALLFAAMNVFFRDFQNIVATFTIFTHWIVPMIYPFSRLATSAIAATAFYTVYLANPLTIGVLLLQRAFWVPTAIGQKGMPAEATDVGFPYLPRDLFLLGWGMLAASLVILVLCQIGFNRLEGKFAERL